MKFAQALYNPGGLLRHNLDALTGKHDRDQHDDE